MSLNGPAERSRKLRFTIQNRKRRRALASSYSFSTTPSPLPLPLPRNIYGNSQSHNGCYNRLHYCGRQGALYPTRCLHNAGPERPAGSPAVAAREVSRLREIHLMLQTPLKELRWSRRSFLIGTTKHGGLIQCDSTLGRRASKTTRCGQPSIISHSSSRQQWAKEPTLKLPHHPRPDKRINSIGAYKPE